MKLYIIQALLWSLSPFLENERGRVDTSLRNKSRNKLRSTLLFASGLDPDHKDFLPVFW